VGGLAADSGHRAGPAAVCTGSNTNVVSGLERIASV
jgi:hypothetical protein